MWDHKDEWRKHGLDFLVHVTRHNGTADEYGRGPNQWAVYAYVYPKHPHFAKFDGQHMWQEAATMMPFHGGPSYLRWHIDNDGKPTSVQVGADYDHLHDEHFTNYATKEDAWEVFQDAECLVEWLTERAK
jgi:hypothetical protein